MMVVFTVLYGCATTKVKQVSLYETRSDIFSRQYTTGEIRAIETGFRADPQQYGKEYAHLLLWMIQNQNYEFSKQLAKLPDLNDGINPEETEALHTIYEYIKDVAFPRNFPDRTVKTYHETISHTLVLEWTSSEKKKWDIGLTIRGSFGDLPQVKNSGFEKEDVSESRDSFSIEKVVHVLSLTENNETDGLTVSLKHCSPYAELFLAVNGKSHDFFVQEVPFVFDGVRVTFKNYPDDHSTSAKIIILNDMTLDGVINDPYRYSPSLEAFLWLILNGEFNPQLFAVNYNNGMTLTKNVWGSMDNQRWLDFNTVINRLNKPELIHHYINKKINYRRGTPHGVYMTFATNKGQSVDAAYFTQYALKKAGYTTFIRSVKWKDGSRNVGHSGSGIIREDGRYVLVADFKGKNNLSGPYKDISMVDNALCEGKPIVDSIWDSYNPPR